MAKKIQNGNQIVTNVDSNDNLTFSIKNSFIDSTPTVNSTNLVTSGGVKSAINANTTRIDAAEIQIETNKNNIPTMQTLSLLTNDTYIDEETLSSEVYTYGPIVVVNLSFTVTTDIPAETDIFEDFFSPANNITLNIYDKESSNYYPCILTGFGIISNSIAIPEGDYFISFVYMMNTGK